jgi:hypothetical protein
MRKHTHNLSRLGFALGFLLIAGCQSTPQQPQDKGIDPLLGAEAPSLPKSNAPASPGGPEARLNAPLPLTQQTSSTAAMAGGPLQGAREPIGIPVNDGGVGKKAWQENDASKTVLKSPQPIAPGQVLAPVPIVSNGISPELQAELEKHKVVYQRQQPVAGGVRFECIVPNPHTPDSLLNFSFEAADIDTAVRTVLAKIDQTH